MKGDIEDSEIPEKRRDVRGDKRWSETWTQQE